VPATKPARLLGNRLLSNTVLSNMRLGDRLLSNTLLGNMRLGDRLFSNTLLGGAALQPCGDSAPLNAALAAEGRRGPRQGLVGSLTDPASPNTTPLADPSDISDPPISLFLMVNTFETGGSERQFTVLAQNLAPPQFHTHLGCISRRGPLAHNFPDAPEFPLGGSLYGWQSLRTRLNLARHLRQHRVQVAHAFDFYTNLTLIPAARLARVPVVIGSHRQLGDLLTPAQFRAQAAAFRWCDMVVCNSQAAAGRLLATGLPPNKIAVIGNALPAEAFTPAPAALPKRPGALRVGMVARMNHRYKNHSGFLRIAAQVHRRMPNIEFLLVGDGPLRQELENEASSLGLGSSAIFLGDRQDISAVLASLDVAVNTSDSESLSNVILEAMAAGLPVVAYEVGGNSELLSPQRGTLIPAGNEAAFADAVQKLLADSALRQQLGENARQFAQDNFSLDHVRQRYAELYGTLLEKKRPNRVPHPSAHFAEGWEPPPKSPPKGSSAKRLRVSIVAPSLRYIGGQSAQADLLLRHWQNDPDIDISFLAVDPPLPRVLAWAERIPGLRTILREPIYLARLRRGLKDVDVAHIFSAAYWSFLLAPAPASYFARMKPRSAKTLINYHSGEARDHLQRFRSAKFVLSRVDKIVVPSGYLVDVFSKFGLPASAVPNIVDLSQFRYRERNPLRPHLVCTRGFSRYYSIDVVVRAFAEIKNEYPEARLDLVGNGPLERDVRKLVSDLNLAGVNFTGVASRQEIGKYYDQADIFINASWLDNMPLSVIEAFASGTPVVTTSPECMPYLVEHERTGLLSPVGDQRALAANVVRLLRDPALAASLAQNAHRESQKYTWQAVREQWLNTYRALM
jgi:glycosyltransferase involved in cell wall biosynthesis